MTNGFCGCGFVFTVIGGLACAAMFLAEQPVPEVTSLQPVTGALTSKVVVGQPIQEFSMGKGGDSGASRPNRKCKN